MENASKALLMAGGVLIALMVIAALLLMFNSLSSYQETGTQDTREAQVVEFNNQYETYLRDNVRGSEMISLMNRINDYNTRKGDNSDEQYQEMQISISGINVENLKYDQDDTKIIKSSYTQNDIGELLEIVKKLETTYQSKYITSLSTNISNIMNSTMDLNVNKSKGQLEAEKILKKELTTSEYNKVKEDTSKYYQYSQFKRVYFNCVTSNTKYNSGTGRIIYIEFICTNKFG